MHEFSLCRQVILICQILYALFGGKFLKYVSKVKQKYEKLCSRADRLFPCCITIAERDWRPSMLHLTRQPHVN